MHNDHVVYSCHSYKVSERRIYVGVEPHDVKAVLAQLREAPCVTVQVKNLSWTDAVLPSCSTLDTGVTSAIARKVMHVCGVGHLDTTENWVLFT